MEEYVLAHKTGLEQRVSIVDIHQEHIQKDEDRAAILQPRIRRAY